MDDLISRQAVLEQINNWIGSGEYRYTNATEYLTKRIKDISCVYEDVISKQDVLEAIDKSRYSDNFCEEHNIDYSINLGMAHIVINELPSIVQKKVEAYGAKEMKDITIYLFIKTVINDFREFQKEWLTSHNDIEFERAEEDLILAFLDDTADTYITEHTE